MRLQKRFIPHLILYWWSEGEIRETIAEAKERLERMLRKMDVSFEKREELRETPIQVLGSILA